MANFVSQVLLTEKPIAGEDACRYSPEVGAIVDFWGIVREMENDRTIEGIDYEAHAAMAEHQMKLIAETAIEKFGLDRVILHHRTGFVGAGEASLFLRVSAAHRGEAFDASKWIVDELKKKVPIWKKPMFRQEAQHRAADTAATTV
jgi:molybdopterin synthase catalytic subunit